MTNWKMSLLRGPVLLSLLILALVGLFVFCVPTFQGPDEQIHYGTVQHRAEPKEKTWPITQSENTLLDGGDITTFHLPEETIKGGQINQFDEIKWQSENTQRFSSLDSSRKEEASFSQQDFKRYIDTLPSNASGTTSFYYLVTGQIEKATSATSFFERFYNARLFSLVLYLGTILITLLVARTLFSSSLHQTLFTLLVAFQPMLLATGTIVNIDIALIFSFTVFFLGALSILRKPNSQFFHALLLVSLLLAFFSKGPGIVLIPLALSLYFYLWQQKYQLSLVRLFQTLFCIGILLILLIVLAIPDSYLASISNLGAPSKFSSSFQSLLTYSDKTLGFDAFLRTHASYWGNFGWLDTKMHTSLLHNIAFIELVAWIGILLFIFSQKTKNYLPKKAIIILSLGMIFFLQLAIRFYDWRVFDTTGKIVIGTPGRYFLPTLIPHLIILVTGLGFLITKNKTQFTTLLKALALSMILLCLYAVFDVIIPRYYL